MRRVQSKNAAVRGVRIKEKESGSGTYELGGEEEEDDEEDEDRVPTREALRSSNC